MEVSFLIFPIQNLQSQHLNSLLPIQDNLLQAFAKVLLIIDKIHMKNTECLEHTDFLAY